MAWRRINEKIRKRGGMIWFHTLECPWHCLLSSRLGLHAGEFPWTPWHVVLKFVSKCHGYGMYRDYSFKAKTIRMLQHLTFFPIQIIVFVFFFTSVSVGGHRKFEDWQTHRLRNEASRDMASSARRNTKTHLKRHKSRHLIALGLSNFF